MSVCALPVSEKPSFLPLSVSRGHKIINKRHSERKKWKSRMRGRGKGEKNCFKNRTVVEGSCGGFQEGARIRPFYYGQKWRILF
jgi:hypothetical protein